MARSPKTESLKQPEAIEEAGRIAPVSEDELLARAWERETPNDDAAAVGIYRELLLSDPANVRARYALGELYRRGRQYTMALEQLEAARVAEPDNADVLSKLGEVLLANGDFDAAERELKRAQRVSPRADVHASLGILYFKRGLLSQAEIELRRAVDLAPDYAVAYFYRGEALNQLGRFDEALEMLERAVQLDPANSRAFYTMGILYDRKNLRAQAEVMYKKAREAATA
jgi:tetratricopeptide (TPR) repeat protein